MFTFFSNFFMYLCTHLGFNVVPEVIPNDVPDNLTAQSKELALALNASSDLLNGPPSQSKFDVASIPTTLFEEIIEMDDEDFKNLSQAKAKIFRRSEETDDEAGTADLSADEDSDPE